MSFTLASLALTAAPIALPQRIGCIWERGADSPIARFESGALPIDGRLYCFGGFHDAGLVATARVDRYDPATDSWTRMADLPTPVTHAAFVRDGDHVWLLGGFVGDHPGVATAEVWRYDVVADQWSSAPSLPRPIAGGGAARLGRSLHYFGGCEADRQTMTGDHWALDLDDLALGWQPRAPLPGPRCHLAGAALGGLAWAVGGQYGHDTGPIDLPWVHRYDPTKDAWSPGPHLPMPRSHFEASTFVEDGALHVAGGRNSTVGRLALSSTLRLDPGTSVWTYQPPLPRPREGAAVQRLGERLYAANGTGLAVESFDDLYHRAWSAQLPNPLYINCGGDEVPAAGGGCWCGDYGTENGAAVAFDPHAEVRGTGDDDLFDMQRREDDEVNYRLPLGNGFFRVRFHMAERWPSPLTPRMLDLVVEGETVAQGVDLLTSIGAEVATQRGFDVEVSDGALDVTVRAASGQGAQLAGLEVERLGSGHFERYCSSEPNSTGAAAAVRFSGTTSVAFDDLTLIGTSLPQNAFGRFVQSRGPGSTTLPGGTLCVEQPLYRLPVEQAVGSVMRHELSIPSPPVMLQQITPGSTWYFQAWYRDTTAAGYGLSDAVKLVFTP